MRAFPALLTEHSVGLMIGHEQWTVIVNGAVCEDHPQDTDTSDIEQARRYMTSCHIY